MARAARPHRRYRGPAVTLSDTDQAKVDEYIAARAAYWASDAGSGEDARTRQRRFDRAKQVLSKRLFDRAERQHRMENEFRNFKEDYRLKGTDDEVRAKMAETVRKAWAAKPIAIRATEDELAGVLDIGRYKTQHELGPSTKTNPNDAGKPVSSYVPQQKANFEHEVWGIPPGTSDWRQRPVYGYVAVNGLDDPGKDRRLNPYGLVQIVLKDAVRDRTTAIMGDSWNDKDLARPSPVDSPTWESYNSRLKPSGGKNVWKWDTSGPGFRDTWYAEAQIHGGVTVDDIAEVTFPASPSTRVQDQLAKAGIRWRIAN